jgi:DNA (cytosine-5)-methyltransferase 1
MSFTIGSLFDGSGGFPLAATMSGGTPTWASEIEPYPIAVTKSRFPKVKHLGSVTDIKGGEVDPVDVITFGSPCQDLSVAGKRAGLKHEANGDDETTRSGLFMEAVRIIKEMREATNGRYPTFALWENVPGAFSSNNGEDFRIVLQELIQIAEPTAVMPEVPKNGWAYADSYCGDGWSIAYRVLDAQHWGVPQRRRRIYLVADFRGERARKVLFEREGLRGYFETGRTPWQTTTGDAESSIGTADCESECVLYSRGYGGKVTTDGVSPTLEARAGTGGNNQPIVAYSIDKAITTGGNCTAGGDCISENVAQTLTTDRPHAVAYGIEPGIAAREGGHIYEGVSGTLRANAGDNRMSVAYGVTTKGNGDAFISEEKHTALSCGGGQAGQGYPCVMESVAYGFDGYNSTETGDKAATLGVNCGMSTGRNGIVEAIGVDRYNQCSTGEVSETLRTPGGGDNYPTVCYTMKIRSECEGGGKGALIQEDKSATLATNNDQYLFQPVVYDGANVTSPVNASNPQPGDPCHTLSTDSRNYVVAIADSIGGQAESAWEGETAPCLKASHYKFAPVVAFPAVGVDVYNQTLTGDKAKTLNSAASDADHIPCTIYPLENHHVSIGLNGEDKVAPTLIARMDTPTCTTQDNLVVCEPVYSLQGCGATSQNSNGIGNKTDTSYTLNTTDVHGVAYSLETFHCISEEEKTTTLKARDYKDPICVTVPCFWDESQTASTLTANNANGAQRMPDKDNFNCVLVAGVDCRNMNELPDLHPTLQAKPNGGQSLNFSHAVRIRYIVRRLTPTECARLQGFPDKWGHPDVKTELTDEEYQFWLNVRNTHAAINDKPTKEYTKEQILKWYNALHTDSSEYKMWGNGIALPNALYVMQGIAEVMSEEKEARKKWLYDLLK